MNGREIGLLTAGIAALFLLMWAMARLGEPQAVWLFGLFEITP